jgi:ribosomal protein S18 acetylase RimI-like enzyme
MRLISPSASQRDHLANAVERAWCHAWGALGYDGATQVADMPNCLRVLTPGSSDLLLNAVLRYRQAISVQRADLEAVIAPFRAARRPFQWWVRAGAEPQHLSAQLEALGMRVWGNPQGMALPLTGWQPPAQPLENMRIHPISSNVEASAALRIICHVFGLAPLPMRRWCVDNPSFITYLATVEQTPAGALVQQIRDGVAGFFHVAVLPLFRRRGVASAMMAQALRHAQRQGAQVAALTASPMAEALYQRLGFIPCCTFHLWMPGATLMSELMGFSAWAG